MRGTRGVGQLALSDNARGALYMSVSMGGFALNDALMKLVSAELPLSQAMFLRGLAASALILLLAWRAGALDFRPRRADALALVLRTCAEIGSTLCFLTALFNMPLANATAILQASPLAVALAAAWLLGEPVGWRRYLAIAVGFAGVLIIVRPGAEGFTGYSLLALAAVGFIVIRDLATRRLTAATPNLYATALTSVAIMAAGGVGAAVEDWPSPSPQALGLLGAASVVLLIGYNFGVMTMRVGDVAVATPFRYSILLWALLLGYALFGDIPDATTLVGAAIVAGAGAFTLWREQRVRRRAQAASQREAGAL